MRGRNVYAILAAVAATSGVVFGTTIDWSIAAVDGFWTTGGNWIGGIAPRNDLTLDIARFDQTSYPNQPNAGTTSILGIQIGDGTTSTASLTLGGTQLTIGTSGINMYANAGPATINSNLTLGANQTWTNNSTNGMTVSGNIGGSYSLTKGGSGTLILNATNTYGITKINGGRLQVGNGGTLGTGNINVVSSAALEINRSDTLSLSQDISGAGSLTKSGTGTLTLAGTNSYTGKTVITGGTLQVGAGGTAGTLGTSTAAVSLSAGTSLVINRSTQETVSQAIGGLGSLTKLGSNTVILTGNNSYGGTTTISDGTLQVGAGGTIGTLGNVQQVSIASGANLAVNRSNSYTVASELAGGGSLTQMGSGVTTLTNKNTYAGGITVSAGTLVSDTTSSLGTGTVTLKGGKISLGGGGTGSVSGFGATGSGWQTNGKQGTSTPTPLYTPTFSNDVLTLTNDTSSIASSAFATVKVDVSKGYEANFVWNATFAGSMPADGFGFILQNDSRGATALGGLGGALGFAAKTPSSAITNSDIIAIDIHNQSSTGHTTNGQLSEAEPPTGSDGQFTNLNTTFSLRNQQPIQVRLVYTPGVSNGTLTQTMTNLVTGAVYTATYNILNIKTTVSGDTAYIGFSGGTGGVMSNQTISDFWYRNTSDSATYTNAFNVDANATAALETAVRNLSLTGGITMGNNAALNLSANATTVGANVPYTISVTSSGSPAVTLSGNNSFNVSSNGTVSLTDVGGTGSLTKTGTGVLLLAGTGAYTGATAIVEGTLKAGSAGAIPSGAGKGNVVANATLDLNGNNVGINGLTGAGTVTNNAATNATLSVGGNDQSSTFGGTIRDGSNGGKTALDKTGAGMLTLSGANTHTGGTTIAVGTLSVANSSALGLESNSLTIGGGATLKTTESFHTSRSTTLGGAGNGIGGTFEVDGGKTLTYTSSSVIGGSGSLIKTGAGTLSLGGVDTYTGGTYIKAGTLVSTSGTAPGPQPPAGSNLYAHHIYDGATLQIAVGSWSTERQIELVGNTVVSGGAAKIEITNGFTQQRNGVIYGAGKLDLVGTGTMIVTNGNTYTGGTSIENGTLQVNNTTGSATGTGNVTVKSGGTLSGLPTAQGAYIGITGAISGSVEVQNGGELLSRSGGTLTLGGLTLDAGAFSTFQLGAVTATPVVNITTANALTLYGGSTIGIVNTGAMAAGTYHLFDYNGSAVANFANLTLAASDSGLFNLSLVDNTTNTSVDLLVSDITNQWKKGGTDTNWSSTSNWLTGLVPNAVSADAIFGNNGGAGFANAESVTLDMNVTVGSISFNNPATAFTITSANGSALTLDETGGNAVIQIFTAPNMANANNVINVPVILAHDLNVGVAAGTYGLDISGVISGEGKSLTKAGAGPLTLSGSMANTYTGLTEVVEGTLKLNKAAGVNAIGTGGLQINNGTTTTLLESNQIADSATVTVNGMFDLGTHSETIATLSGGGSVTTDTGGVLTMNSSMDSSFIGIISGAGGIAKAGSGTLALNGGNSYSGGTAINGGTLQVGADNNMGESAGGISFNGGTLSFSGGFTSNRNVLLNSGGGGTIDTDGSGITLAGVISGGGTLTKIGTGTITLGTANTYTGQTIVNNGILRISHADALGAVGPGQGTTVSGAGAEIELKGDITVQEPLTRTGGVVGNLYGTNTWAGAIALTGNSEAEADSGTLVITGTISGAYGMEKAGAGNVRLAGSNTFSGNIVVEAGALQAAALTAIPHGAGKGNVTVENAGTLDLYGTDITINGLSGPGTVTNSVAGSATLTAGDNNQYSQFEGVIQDGAGAVAIAKTGTDTLILAGRNTYSGVTTISGGTLQVGAGGTAGTLGTNASIVNNGNLKINHSDSVTLTQAISGTGSFTQAGAGTTTLLGDKAYTGATAVDAGTLAVSGNLASSAVTVASGAKLTGISTITGSVTVSGTIAPGMAVGDISTLASGAQTWNSGGVYEVDVASAATSDQVVMSSLTLPSTGSFTIKASPTDDFISSFDPTSPPTIHDWVIARVTTGSFGSIAHLNLDTTLFAGSGKSNMEGYHFSLFSGGDTGSPNLVLRYDYNAVPEATTLVLGIAGLAPLLLQRRRRAPQSAVKASVSGV